MREGAARERIVLVDRAQEDWERLLRVKRMDRGDNNIVGVGSGGSGGSGGGGGGGIGLGVGCHVGNSGSPPNSTSSTHGTMHNSSGGFDGQVAHPEIFKSDYGKSCVNICAVVNLFPE